MKPEVKGFIYMVCMLVIMVATSMWIAGISKIH